MFRVLAIFGLFLIATSAVSAQNKSRTWLTGTWEGTGYQMDDNTTWTMKLTVRGNSYRIEYPSLNCSGRWIPLSVGSTRAKFRERLAVGLGECADHGKVDVQRLSPRQIAYRYTFRGERDIGASAILNRKR